MTKYRAVKVDDIWDEAQNALPRADERMLTLHDVQEFGSSRYYWDDSKSSLTPQRGKEERADLLIRLGQFLKKRLKGY